MYIRYMAPRILLFMLFIIFVLRMNDLVLALIHGRFCLYIFVGDVTRRLIIRLGFLLDLFIFPAILFVFLYVNLDLLKKNVKGALRCHNGLIFCRVVSQTVLYLPVKFHDNPSFVWRSATVLVLGFNRRNVRDLCFLGQKP